MPFLFFFPREQENSMIWKAEKLWEKHLLKLSKINNLDKNQATVGGVFLFVSGLVPNRLSTTLFKEC